MKQRFDDKVGGELQRNVCEKAFDIERCNDTASKIVFCMSFTKLNMSLTTVE